MSLTFGEAYPEIGYGQVDQACNADNDCEDGLVCSQDPKGRGQTCQVPKESMKGCQRTPFDQRCHQILNNGYKGMCPDSACSPQLAPALKPVPQWKCDAAHTYYHRQTNSSFCIYVDEHTGVPEQVPGKCCDRIAISDVDVPNQLVRDGFPIEFYHRFTQ